MTDYTAFEVETGTPIPLRPAVLRPLISIGGILLVVLALEMLIGFALDAPTRPVLMGSVGLTSLAAFCAGVGERAIDHRRRAGTWMRSSMVRQNLMTALPSLAGWGLVSLRRRVAVVATTVAQATVVGVTASTRVDTVDAWAFCGMSVAVTLLAVQAGSHVRPTE